MSKKAVAGTATQKKIGSVSELLVKTREMYSAALFEPDLFFTLISASDDDPVEPDPYAGACDLLETIIGMSVAHWDGTKEDGLEFLDIAIELARAPEVKT